MKLLTNQETAAFYTMRRKAGTANLAAPVLKFTAHAAIEGPFKVEYEPLFDDVDRFVVKACIAAIMAMAAISYFN